MFSISLMLILHGRISSTSFSIQAFHSISLTYTWVSASWFFLMVVSSINSKPFHSHDNEFLKFAIFGNYHGSHNWDIFWLPANYLSPRLIHQFCIFCLGLCARHTWTGSYLIHAHLWSKWVFFKFYPRAVALQADTFAQYKELFLGHFFELPEDDAVATQHPRASHHASASDHAPMVR